MPISLKSPAVSAVVLVGLLLGHFPKHASAFDFRDAFSLSPAAHELRRHAWPWGGIFREKLPDGFSPTGSISVMLRDGRPVVHIPGEPQPLDYDIESGQFSPAPESSSSPDLSAAPPDSFSLASPDAVGDEPTNDGDLGCGTCDGKFEIRAGGSNSNPKTPVALLDASTLAVLDTFAFDGFATGVACCDDGTTVLVALLNDDQSLSQIRKLMIGPGGELVDTGAFVEFSAGPFAPTPAEIRCLPGSGFALFRLDDEVISLSVATMEIVDRITAQGGTVNGLAASCDIPRFCVRSGDGIDNDYIECFAHDPATGDIITPRLFVSRVTPVLSSFLYSPLGVSHDGTRILAVEENPAGLRLFDGGNGSDLGLIDGTGMVEPTTVITVPCCFDTEQPTSPNPAIAQLQRKIQKLSTQIRKGKKKVVRFRKAGSFAKAKRLATKLRRDQRLLRGFRTQLGALL